MMDIETLIRLSGIEKKGRIDYAVPLHSNGSYPHLGDAIGFYPNEGGFRIVSYAELAYTIYSKNYDLIESAEEIKDLATRYLYQKE